jgi:HAD superfamily hydrolase (TIGR01509 family)
VAFRGNWHAKRLVLFDLDGVLLDSRENMRRSWQKVREQFGTDVTFDRYFSEIGRPFPVIMERLSLSNRAAEIEATFRMASMDNLDVLRFYPDVPETLRKLQDARLKLGIVTSKDLLRTNAILAMLPVTFACVHAPDGKMRGKPAPDHLLMAMALTGVDPAEALYVGDMAADYEAAQRAQIDYAHANWGYGAPPAGECWKLPNIQALLELIRGRKIEAS